VTSPEVPWVDPNYYAEPSDSRSIVRIMERSLRNPRMNINRNLRGLRRYSDASKVLWSIFCGTGL
jgi:hypothetical protein